MVWAADESDPEAGETAEVRLGDGDGDRKGKAAEVVALRGVVKRYGEVEALRGLELTVREGEVVGFLGRNGAGKSTALRIIMGITHPSAGEVRLFGQPLRGEDPAVRQRIGYVAQEQAFYGWMTPLALGKFVRGFYPRWDDSEFRRLLGLLDIPADRRIQTFSGGTHAKLALAVALAHRPELLVLDEPTAGMDAVARREFLELVRLQAQRTGRATLFSSHLIDEVELAADTVGIVDGGRLLWQGPPRVLQGQFRRLRHRGTGDAQAQVDALLAAGGGLQLLEDSRLEDGQRDAPRTLLVRADGTGSPADTALALQGLERLAQETGDWQVEQPSLEDVFVALVRRPVTF